MIDQLNQLIDQVKTVIEWSNNTVKNASSQLTESQYEALEIGYLDDEIKDLEEMTNKLSLELWKQEVNATFQRT